ncbi:MAG: nitroreductase family protein [Candidatus Hodarchaeota archaeon]
MDVLEAIKSRRSIRKYKYNEIDHEIIVKLLEAAQWAPSGGNKQPWQFIIVSDKPKIKMLKMASPGFYGDEAALVFVICLDKERAEGIDYGVNMDLGMAAQNVMLAAYALGLGSCAIASFTPRAVKNILNVPDTLELKLLISIGYPAQIPKTTRRRPLNELVYVNGYPTRWSE